MLHKLNIMKIFPICLAISLVIGIGSNLVILQNPEFTGLVVVILMLVWFLWPIFRNFANQLTNRTVNIILWSGMILIFLVQIGVLHYLPVSVYHDPFRVLYQAELLSRDHYNWSAFNYFWRYPNNVPLTFLLSKWLKFTMMFHLTINTAVHILTIGFLDGFIIMLLMTVKKLSRNNSSVLALLLFFIITPFSYTYYLQVFYSDLPIMLGLLIIFNILVHWQTLSKSKKIIAGIILFLTVLLNQLVKPNLIVLVAAIVVLSLFLLIVDAKKLRRLLLPFLIILIGFGATIPLKPAINQAAHFSNNTKYELPSLHWIWMSYNPTGHGTYRGSDVVKMMKLPDTDARKTYLEKAIPKRIEKLGVTGVFVRWIEKAGILLNAGSLQQAYSGGFIQAPVAYQKIRTPLSIAGRISMSVSFILLYATVLVKCIRLIKQSKYEIDSIRDLAIILSLGYIAFHTFVWETESRYGQPIFPLLIIISSMLPDVKLIWLDKIQRSKIRIATVLVIGSILMGISIQPYRKYSFDKGLIAVSQRSQLSVQYAPKLQKFDDNQQITQEVELTAIAHKMNVQVPGQSKITGRLINLQTGKSYTLKKGVDSLKLKHKLPIGKYKILLESSDKSKYSASILETQAYKLAPYSLKVDGESKANASLIYKFIK